MPDQFTAHPVADTADGHLGLDDLADLAAGEAPEDPAVAAWAEAHLAACSECRAELAQVRADLDLVSTSLASLDLGSLPVGKLQGAELPRAQAPGAEMPVTVAARLDRVLAEESEPDRSNVLPLRRPTPVRAPATASYVKQTGFLKLMLVAAVAASVVGFGGYVISASTGMNEPTAVSPVQVHPDGLASQATEIAEVRDVDPHLFSAAWRCARRVIDSRITGITPVYSEGEETYLVYTRVGGVKYARLLYGCSDDTPTAGPPVRLTE
ncbi:MAG: hypothetical protein QM650_09730 [Microlunatus sp.]